MKLTRVHIRKAATCGGLLDGLDVDLRNETTELGKFEPLCLVGANGAGKSQFLQVIAEAFQTVFYEYLGDEERARGNEGLQFELEYLIKPDSNAHPVHVRLSRISEGKRRPNLKIERKFAHEWLECLPLDSETVKLLPARIVGYTSGDNETLSLPFLLSRAAYADAVGKQALAVGKGVQQKPIPDTRLMLVDYGTHLEVLVANLLMGSPAEWTALFRDAKLKEINSFRCVIQLAHRAVPRLSGSGSTIRRRKGVQLTEELERYLDQIKRCSTCFSYVEKTETYIFDFLVSDQTREAFRHFWQSTIELYSSFHKLSMLNDLAIPKVARERLLHDIRTRRFASRLPEPQDEDRVFRFEQVRFILEAGQGVDYVSLSDGEHQLAQILGTMCMISIPNSLFLLDEPESHFNPQWRVKFISRLMTLPTANGARNEIGAGSTQQDCLLTTHSPFVPSDMSRENVMIFKKVEQSVEVTRPMIETFGTTFDTILEECFNVRPPMSDIPRREIDELMASNDREAVQACIARLGDSVEKVFLMDHLRQLSK